MTKNDHDMPFNAKVCFLGRLSWIFFCVAFEDNCVKANADALAHVTDDDISDKNVAHGS